MEEENLIEKFFPQLDWDGWHLSQGGYMPIVVSFFERHMSQDELAKVDFAAIHQKAEENFILLYKRLMKEGAYVLKGELMSFFPEMNKEFSTIIVNSMRSWKLFSAYFPALKIRVQSRFDLSDILLLREKEVLPLLEKDVSESGLFILSGSHLM